MNNHSFLWVEKNLSIRIGQAASDGTLISAFSPPTGSVSPKLEGNSLQFLLLTRSASSQEFIVNFFICKKAGKQRKAGTTCPLSSLFEKLALIWIYSFSSSGTISSS